MCGIAGYFSKREEHGLEKALGSAINELQKRGPDFRQTLVLSPHVAFGHARLSIIDTSLAANQPMADKSGRYVIVFNGEIFNYAELKSRFLQEQALETASDTEVLLYLFIKLGKDCLQ
ncbi:MAG TPA: hypothetical protein VG603_16170, partial [Chitinophagales bacterium]|nr:hypothetical protein [Chitinophagales bacterium]